jgi:hypothetical protein
MRAACVFIPHFPIAIELLARPACTGGPVVIGGAPEQRKAVLDCSPEGRSPGGAPGKAPAAGPGPRRRQARRFRGASPGRPSHPSRPPDHCPSRRPGGGLPGPPPQAAQPPNALRALHRRRCPRRAAVAGQRLCQPLEPRDHKKADDRRRKPPGAGFRSSPCPLPRLCTDKVQSLVRDGPFAS